MADTEVGSGIQSSNVVSSAGSGTDNSSIVESSSLTGGTPPPQQVAEAKKSTPPPPSTNLSMKDFDNAVKDTVKNPTTEQDSQNAAKLFKLLLDSRLNNFTAQDFQVANMLFFRYDAKYKENVYDKTPLIFTLRKSRGYLLGLNLHWTPIPLRMVLVKYILQVNKQNIRNNAPLNISYAMLKPLIAKLNLGPVIRLYIFSRISRRGLKVPPEQWLSASKLKSESFTGGYSADRLYKQALRGAKDFKQSRGRRTKAY